MGPFVDCDHLVPGAVLVKVASRTCLVLVGRPLGRHGATAVIAPEESGIPQGRGARLQALASGPPSATRMLALLSRELTAH